MKRQGFLAAGLLSSATALCLLLNRHGGLGASEEQPRSFREALAGTKETAATEVEDGIRLNYFDTTWGESGDDSRNGFGSSRSICAA